MSIIAAAIVPHTPILIPQIGKKNLKKLEATRLAINKLAKNFAAKKIDTIFIISPHGPIQDDVFTINMQADYKTNFEEFGDFSTTRAWPGHIGLMHKIREALETTSPLQLISDEPIDYGASVPLLLLTEKLPNVKIIPVSYSGLPNDAHYLFGSLVKKQLQISTEQIAVVASGELSHRLTKETPAGYSPRGKKFDGKLIELLRKNKSQDIVNLDPELTGQAGECGLKSILILLGILNNVNYKPQLMSYEAPFGVGCLVMNFIL